MGKKRMKLLWRFMVSYIIVLFLPLSVILFYYYPYFTTIVKQKEMDWNTNVTEQVTNSMDIFLKSVYTLPASIVGNREIKLSLLKDDEYQRTAVVNEMMKYNSSDALFFNTFLYVKKSGFLFSSTGYTYKINEFMNPKNGYSYASWNQEQFVHDLNQLTSIRTRSMEDVTILGEGRVKMITLLVPLPLGNSRSDGCVVFMIKYDTLARMMKSVSNSYTGDFIILDKDNKLIFSLNDRSDLESDQFTRFLNNLHEHRSGIYNYDETSYIASKSVSLQNGWSYVSINPLEVALHQTKETQRNTFILVGIILLIEIIIIYVSIRKNYFPIKALVQFSRDIFANDEADKPVNELDIIRSALHNLSITNNKLDENIKRSVPKMRDNFLLELVSGHFTSLEQFVNDSHNYGLNFSYPKCSVSVITVEGDTETVFKELKKCETFLSDGVDGYFIKSITHEDILFVSTHRPEASLLSLFMELQKDLAITTGSKLYIGIGNSMDNPNGFHTSYMNALRAVEHLRMKSEASIITFEALKEHINETVPYPAESIHSLELFILTNDVPEVRKTVSRLIIFLQNDRTPPFMIRAVYLNITNIILSSLLRFRHKEGLDRLGTTAFHNRFSVDQMTKILRESTDLLCNLMETAAVSTKSATFDDVLHFIEKNEFKANFSLQTIADHFAMSVSNFSHYFKKLLVRILRIM